MQEPEERKLGTPLSEKEAEQYFRLREMLFEFARLFDYGETNDRAIAIVGPAFLDTLLTEMLINFLVDDEKEVRRLLQPEAPLGTFGTKISACYCLGLIGETIKSDLRIIAKIRNRLAHDLRAGFSDEQIKSWCRSLRWHRESLCEPPSDATTRDLFQVGVHQLVCHLNGLVGLALYHKRPKPLYIVATLPQMNMERRQETLASSSVIEGRSRFGASNPSASRTVSTSGAPPTGAT